MRNIVNNHVNYPPLSNNESSPKSFRQAVEIALRKNERLLNDLMEGERRHRAVVTTEAEMARRRAIKEFYEENYVYSQEGIKNDLFMQFLQT